MFPKSSSASSSSSSVTAASTREIVRLTPMERDASCLLKLYNKDYNIPPHTVHRLTTLKCSPADHFIAQNVPLFPRAQSPALWYQRKNVDYNLDQESTENPESLDSSIQSALSSLFPPFDLTAPIVLSQLFRTIEERYHGDALHCLLDFLIPAKHVLESIQQAACASFCDVLFRCEGWPLCLHDRTVIQLAPVNPLLLRPGDFYLQVTPFGDQAARIVLKSLLEEGCKEVEETPIPETSYPIIFTEEWLREFNEGRHGTPLSRCLLCTDQGIVKMSWEKIAIPEFLDKPKTIPIMSPVFKDPEPSRFQHPSHFNSSTLPLEMVLPPKHKMSASLRHPHYSSRVIKSDRKSKPLVKPVGWVSPNTWDRPSEKELEGDYVDLLEIAKERGQMDKNDRKFHLGLIKAYRPPQPKLGTQCLAATLQYSENPFVPCGDVGISDEELKCRYRESYTAALKNPVAFEKGNIDLLTALDEFKSYKEGEGKSIGSTDIPKDGLGTSLDNCKEDNLGQELCQFKQFCEPATVKFASHLKDLKKTTENITTDCTSEFFNIGKADVKTDCGAKGVTDAVMESPDRKIEVLRGSGKHKSKMRSLSAVSESTNGSPLLLHSRSHSDICPEMINSVVLCHRNEGPEQVPGKQERRKSPKSEFQSSPVQEAEVQTVKASLPLFESSPVSVIPSAPPEEGALSGVSSLLELGIMILPGSRDRTGRAVVEVHGDRKEWGSPLVSAPRVCKLLLHLHTVPRRDVSELGLTLIINSKKKPPPPCLYRALLLAQEQALHTVHSLILLVDKDTSPRPEKQSGLQMDVVTSLKALYKVVEASQLTPELGGTFVYCHTSWLQLHQRLRLFMSDLKGADSLLQKAIQQVEGAKKLDTAQDVLRCIEEQKSLMMEVLKDARLVMLQREGGAVLARIRKDQHRFPQSEDYRDALDSATLLYNQVEENLHALVMRSNRSLQHLDVLLTLRETEACVTETGSWLNSEGEQVVKNLCPTEETQAAAEVALQHFTHFITQAKEKQEYSYRLVKKAGQVLQSTTESGPTTEVFQTLVSTFKSNMEDFMARAEKRLRELETLVHVYGFCEQALSWAEECNGVLDQLEPGSCSPPQSPPPQTDPGPLQMYEDRLGHEFSTSRFQNVKAQIRALGPGPSRVWNSAWERRQKVKQRLDEMQKKRKKKCLDKAKRVTTSVDCQGSEEGRVQDWKSGSYKELDDNLDGANEKGGSINVKDEVKNEKHAQNGRQKQREHSSETDLTNCDENKELSHHKILGRSLSEGSKFKPHFTLLSDFSPLNVQPKQTQPEEDIVKLGRKLSLACNRTVGSGDEEEVVEDKQGAGLVLRQSSKDLPSPDTLLTPAMNNGSNILKLQCILEELLSTEREYVKALGYVREQYCPELERPDVPQDLRGQRGSVFGNLEKLHDFHQHHFLFELESCASEPLRVGRCFLRHRDSFALYALYSKNKPVSDKLLTDHGKAFFKQKQVELGDRMDLWSYLLKPIQRISKYGLLLQDLLRECGPGQEQELEEIRAALEVVQFQLRHGNNLLAMDAILQCDVNLKEQGPLIRQDELSVTFRKRKCLRHVFLFQELVLFSKTRKTEVGSESYIYKQSFKTSDIGMTQNSGDSGLCFEIWFRKRKSQDTYTLQAASKQMKEAWTKDLERILWEQALRNKEVRLQERVFLGIGNKPFMDIQPSDAAINTRAVNCVLMGKESRAPSVSSLGSSGSRDALPVMRQKSIGSSSSSSSSSGRGSLSPGGFLCGPKKGAVGAGLLEEDDLDQDNGCQNLLLDSSESFGESVSGLGSRFGTVGLEPEADNGPSVCSSVCSSVVTVKHSEGPNSCVGKSTEV